MALGSNAQAVEMLMIAPPFCACHDRRHQPRRADDVHQIDVDARVPLLVGDLEDRRARAVAGAVDQHVDAAPRVPSPGRPAACRSSFDWLEPVTPMPPSSSASASPLPDDDRIATL